MEEEDPIVSADKSEVVQQLVEQEIAKQNQQIFADQKEIDGRVLAGNQEERQMLAQAAIDNLNAARTLNKGFGTELQSIAQKDMESQFGPQKKSA